MQAMEPFFSVLLSSIFLGEVPTLGICLALVPVVGGVALASFSEASFNWAGFGAAMGSNITFQVWIFRIYIYIRNHIRKYIRNPRIEGKNTTVREGSGLTGFRV